MNNQEFEKDNLKDITTLEKEDVKGRIFNSINRYRRRKLRIFYGVGTAASILFFSFLGVYYYSSNGSDIQNFLNEAGKIEVSESANVKLILSDNKEVEIQDKFSSISYSKNGQKVNTGKTNTITQNIKSSNKIAYNTLIVPYGRRSKVKLSDGSIVWLNSGSKLVYPSVFKDNKREVYLEGEAIFDVAHNRRKPFTVIAKDHEIEVLGTVFNVTNYIDEDNVNTTLETGSIQINYSDNSFFKKRKSFKVSPGKMATYNKTKKEISLKKVNVANHFSWRDGILIFKNDNLNAIMKRISRYYNVEIDIQNEALSNEKFSGHLDLKNNIEKVIQIIKETSDFDYEKITNNKIIIN